MIKFGTGGWRAIIGEDFIIDNVKLLSQAIAIDIINNGYDKNGIVIGYDRRFLSDKASKWVAEVLAGNGIPVYYIAKVSPTPLIMFAVKHLKTQYGIAVTASHNPAEYNGIKVFTEGGKDASEEVTKKLESIIKKIEKDDVISMEFERAVKENLIQFIDPQNSYIDSILSMVDIEAIRKRNLKVLLDPMFGVSKTSLQTILLTARCDVDIINDRHDALFGGMLPSPDASTLKDLMNAVIKGNYDIGIATDGDADRVGIIDDSGKFIHPNEIMVLLYYYLLRYKGWKGGVVRNIATTHLLDRIAAAYGEKCYEVPVGFKHISSKMQETNAMVGGESSGGLTIRGHIKGKDGIFAATLLVELMSITGKRLSELLNEIYREYGQCFMVENNFKFSLEDKQKYVRVLFEEKRIPDYGSVITKISYIDGVKIYFSNGGWIIARFSGTEPLLRIFAEMETKEQALEISKIMSDFLYKS